MHPGTQSDGTFPIPPIFPLDTEIGQLWKNGDQEVLGAVLLSLHEKMPELKFHEVHDLLLDDSIPTEEY